MFPSFNVRYLPTNSPAIVTTATTSPFVMSTPSVAYLLLQVLSVLQSFFVYKVLVHYTSFPSFLARTLGNLFDSRIHWQSSICLCLWHRPIDQSFSYQRCRLL